MAESTVFSVQRDIFLDGSDFTVMAGQLYVDGEKTEIRVEEATNGRRGGYKFTERIFRHGDDVFDLMAPHTPEEVEAWVRERMGKD